MATDDLYITSNDWRIVRENLVQLHCEDVSWEQASDKIPLDLGDPVQNLSTLVFLRGNRCLSTINWTQIPDSISVWENMLNDFFDRKVHKQVGHYRFTYMSCVSETACFPANCVEPMHLDSLTVGRECV